MVSASILQGVSPSRGGNRPSIPHRHQTYGTPRVRRSARPQPFAVLAAPSIAELSASIQRVLWSFLTLLPTSRRVVLPAAIRCPSPSPACPEDTHICGECAL